MAQAVKTYKIGVISLGCDKNRVDTEKMLYRIQNYGHTIVNDINLADIVIINTCAFLQSARQESIFTAIETYSQNEKKPIIMTGCLPQKFINELYYDLTEVTAFLGVNDYDKINIAIDNVIKGIRYKKINTDNNCNYIDGRILTTPKHYAYLKISDGCDKHCTYCLIPYIKGKYRSLKIEDIVKETNNLVNSGIKEIILVAQDVTSYGIDLYEKYSIVKLLQELSKIKDLPDNSIRLLYCYPELVTDDLIQEIKNNKKVIKYLDIPMQHISDKILKMMGRKTSSLQIKDLITKLRKEIENISLRSTFIVGFPDETEQDFKTLCDFLNEYKIDNAGFFAYSREKGTPSYNYKGQISDKIKEERLNIVNQLQQNIYLEKNKSKIGKKVTVICDGYDTINKMYFGRTYSNAPQIDKYVYFASINKINSGDKLQIFIESCTEYDLYGKVFI